MGYAGTSPEEQQALYRSMREAGKRPKTPQVALSRGHPVDVSAATLIIKISGDLSLTRRPPAGGWIGVCVFITAGPIIKLFGVRFFLWQHAIRVLDCTVQWSRSTFAQFPGELDV
jgi:hypothetical protein